MDMVGEAIEQRAGQALIPEDARPFLERQIRRNDSRAAFMTLAEDLEEELGAGLEKRHIAEFVDDEQFDGDCARREIQVKSVGALLPIVPKENRSLGPVVGQLEFG